MVPIQPQSSSQAAPSSKHNNTPVLSTPASGTTPATSQPHTPPMEESDGEIGGEAEVQPTSQTVQCRCIFLFYYV